MDYSKLIERVKLILTSPNTEWNKIDTEQTSAKELYLGYILILAAITPVAGFLKLSIFGVKIPFMGRYRLGIGASLTNMVFTYAFSLAGVHMSGTMTSPRTGMQGSGSFDKNSIGGKLENWSNKKQNDGHGHRQ
jgi:hypothetical protein